MFVKSISFGGVFAITGRKNDLEKLRNKYLKNDIIAGNVFWQNVDNYNGKNPRLLDATKNGKQIALVLTGKDALPENQNSHHFIDRYIKIPSKKFRTIARKIKDLC